MTDSVEIPLTQGYRTTIDREDAWKVLMYSWSLARCNGKLYARGKVNGTIELLHRFLMGAVKGELIDHEDRDGLNNRKSNLRRATHAQNLSNSRLSLNNTSGYKGVYWDEKSQKWRAQITIDGKLIRLGWFEKIDDAALAYNAKARELRGEFAFQNKVNECTA